MHSSLSVNKRLSISPITPLHHLHAVVVKSDQGKWINSRQLFSCHRSNDKSYTCNGFPDYPVRSKTSFPILGHQTFPTYMMDTCNLTLRQHSIFPVGSQRLEFRTQVISLSNLVISVHTY